MLTTNFYETDVSYIPILQIKPNEEGTLKYYGCGGILISSKFGITADHCIDDTRYLKNATFFAGMYKWRGFPNPDDV